MTRISPTQLSRRLAAAAIAALGLVLGFASAPASAAEFGIRVFDGQVSADKAGAPYTQAGGHPYAAWTAFEFETAADPVYGFEIPFGDVRDVDVELPPGLIGNPEAVPACPSGQFLAGLNNDTCPVDTIVGLGLVKVPAGITFGSAIYRITTPPGAPAAFGAKFSGAPVILTPKLRQGDYGLTMRSIDTSQALSVIGAKFELWGTPWSPQFDSVRCGEPFALGPEPICSGAPGNIRSGPNSVAGSPTAFLSLPTACTPAGQGLETRLRLNTWQTSTVFHEASFESHLPPAYPEPEESWGPPQGPTGCAAVPFKPSIEIEPTNSQADSPTGLSVRLRLPQAGLEAPKGLATAHLKKVEVKLPAGMAASPAAASGLAGCSDAQFGLGLESPISCPEASRIGTVEVDTPLLADPLHGSVYLAKQKDNPFGSLLALYIGIEDLDRGITLKIAGRVDPDPDTGRLTATFDGNPQLPFTEMRLRFNDGPRAPLVNPPTCGVKPVESRMYSWAAPSQAVTLGSSFQITSGPNGAPCPNGSFDPHLSAGTTNPVAGAYSPFTLRLTRDDGTQELARITARLPQGLTGKLAGIPYCSDSALAGIPGAEGTGAAQIASPSCSEASRIGTVTVGAGAGPNPFYVETGKAYLAGPYKGAPLSMAFVTPAVAGPFDLGNVVVRAALEVDQRTAQITAVSDPLPRILHGIPLDLRDVRVKIDRNQFTLNPTSCKPGEIAATITSVGGTTAQESSRFQVGSCASLPFEPKLKLQLKGATKRSGHPALKAVVTYPKEGTYANIARAQVGLPHSEFLDQGNLDKVCKQADLRAASCPKESIYGYARAWTPLLAEPLQGPVYLGVGFGYKLPALVADLNGQIRILLVGRVDTTKRKGIRNTFEVVPDAPVSRFELRMKGGKQYGLLENSENVCKKKQRASVLFTAQNGEVLHMRPTIANGCGKKKGQKRKGHARRR